MSSRRALSHRRREGRKRHCYDEKPAQHHERRGDGKPAQSKNTIGQDDRRFPARSLGEIVIVEIGEKVSIGLVTLAVQEMGLGDIVMMQKSQ